MKRYWRFLMALMIGSTVLVGPGMLNMLAAPAPQDHGQGKDNGERDHGRGHGKEKENRGRRMKWDRDHDGRYRFDDHDRGAVDNYFRDHRYRYARERVPEVEFGYVVEPRYRRYCHPAPAALVEELPPPPYGYRYFLYGGNVVLLDGGYRVQDFIHVSLNFGR